MVPQLLIRASCLLVLASQAGLAGQRISLQDYGRTCRSEARQAGAPGFLVDPCCSCLEQRLLASGLLRDDRLPVDDGWLQRFTEANREDCIIEAIGSL
ncbi:MAG: hypothetical protein ERJ67_08695 [Aphanocapsa feldmannii 277cV]|uniref:Uncharacterized protein n=2 Tax=Aphanocapsa feldmannii TaxID=192050 RepID=A0A524RL72_9CHRO|nr:MAG: hypothetical protein ERJ67_08695 [Aphanocapsa feldmannii 277cV]TGH27306.1 MAG: hypothetical protein ERJ68_01230 [Aphanocapsa feldmannii 277cI]